MNYGLCIIRLETLEIEMEDEYDTILGRILNELPKKNVVFFLSFWKILYLSRRTTFADSSSFPSRLYGAQDRETFTPEYDVEVQFNFAIIAKLRMNSNKSYEAVQCQLTCNFVLPYWTSSAKTAFEEKDTNHRVRELLSEHTHTCINYAINGKSDHFLRNRFAITFLIIY